MYLIEIKPGEAPAITQGDAPPLRCNPPKGTLLLFLDKAEMFVAEVNKQAQDWQTEPCCTILALGQMLYGTVKVYRTGWPELQPVRAEDLGRVEGLLRLSDYYEEVSGL